MHEQNEQLCVHITAPMKVDKQIEEEQKRQSDTVLKLTMTALHVHLNSRDARVTLY